MATILWQWGRRRGGTLPGRDAGTLGGIFYTLGRWGGRAGGAAVGVFDGGVCVDEAEARGRRRERTFGPAPAAGVYRCDCALEHAVVFYFAFCVSRTARWGRDLSCGQVELGCMVTEKVRIPICLARLWFMARGCFDRCAHLLVDFVVASVFNIAA